MADVQVEIEIQPILADQPPFLNMLFNRRRSWFPRKSNQIMSMGRFTHLWCAFLLNVYSRTLLWFLLTLGTSTIIAHTVVPMMTGTDGDTARMIQLFLFMSGLHTLLQSWLGTRLPTVMGPSFVFPGAITWTIKDFGHPGFDWNPKYMKRVHPVARAVFGKYPVLISLGLSWAFGAILTAYDVFDCVLASTQLNSRTDSSHLISPAPWVKLPYPFQYGLPIFRASGIFGMMGVALVSAMEVSLYLLKHLSIFKFSGATLPPSHVLSRSMGLQGIGQLASGLFGAPLSTTISAENVGLTSIGSRRVIQVSAAFMLIFSIFGKFAAVFVSIALSIFGGVYCILLCTVAACGISFIQFVNTNSLRNMFVLGVSIFLGIMISQYFALTDGVAPIQTDTGWFNIIANTLLGSAPAIASIHKPKMRFLTKGSI